MSSAPTNASFYISGINHSELRPGQQLTLDHLRALQQQLAENVGRARALQQQLQQQAQQHAIRAAAPGGAAVKAEPGLHAGVTKEEDGPQQPPQQPQQLQYAALLALQLQQQQQQARVAAAQAQQQAGAQAPAAQQRPQGAPAGTTAFGAGPSALANNVFPAQGPGASNTAQAGGAGGPGAARPGPTGMPGHGGAAGGERKPRKTVEEPATDQWVQCSKCSQWRQVPDEFWPDITNADEDEDWRCKDALWDVEDYEPHTAPCC